MPSPSAGCPLNPSSTTATPRSLMCGPTGWCCGRSSPTACSPTTGWLMKRSSTMWGMGTSSPAQTIVHWSSTTWCGSAGASCLLTGPASPASTGSWSACMRGLWPPHQSEGCARGVPCVHLSRLTRTGPRAPKEWLHAKPCFRGRRNSLFLCQARSMDCTLVWLAIPPKCRGWPVATKPGLHGLARLLALLTQYLC